jgi:hypothetical protein
VLQNKLMQVVTDENTLEHSGLKGQITRM